MVHVMSALMLSRDLELVWHICPESLASQPELVLTVTDRFKSRLYRLAHA